MKLRTQEVTHEEQLDALERRSGTRLREISQNLRDNISKLAHEREQNKKLKTLHLSVAEKDAKILFLSGQVEALQTELLLKNEVWKGEYDRAITKFQTMLDKVLAKRTYHETEQPADSDSPPMNRSPEPLPYRIPVSNNWKRVNAEHAQVRFDKDGTVDVKLIQSARSSKATQNTRYPPNITVTTSLAPGDKPLVQDDASTKSKSPGNLMRSLHSQVLNVAKHH